MSYLMRLANGLNPLDNQPAHRELRPVARVQLLLYMSIFPSYYSNISTAGLTRTEFQADAIIY
ncbi:MAG: hypothetical protein EZS28_043466, partial [Streblomastix strix]